ncbi:MAG: cobalamin biosynthesis protein CbiD [Lachnospiraceae bacterium]|nr:cobalamin biosynthesis protein CbiD [Lachnospiraceae bacterium]
MSFEHYIRSGQQRLRLGYTTGTCAALAAKAATELLLTGRAPERISVMTGRGIEVTVPVERWGIDGYADGYVDESHPSENGRPFASAVVERGGTDIAKARMRDRKLRCARCSVIKDAGDDPDVTDGIEIVATVRKAGNGSADATGTALSGGAVAANAKDQNDAMRMAPDALRGNDRPERTPVITIDGGEGVGRVTKPGLDQPVGAAAINSAPRKQISEAVREICEACGFFGSLEVVISVPEGEAIAKKTFNPAIGVVGGISILGTSGIEYPMSEDAIIKSIEVELHQARQLSENVIITPGNYGEKCIEKYGLNDGGIPVVRFSGYLGEALDICVAEGFENVLLVSHIGKLVKTAGGIMNTHQRNADCRMELFTAHAAICGADTTVCKELMRQTTTDACIAVLDEAEQKSTSLRDRVIRSLMEAIDEHLNRRVDGKLKITAVMFSNRYGILARTDEKSMQ